MALALLMGTALIAVGVTGIVVFDRLGTFTVDWVESDEAAATATVDIASVGQTAVAEASVADTFVSTVQISVPACTDTFQAPLDEPAQIRWSLQEHRQDGAETRVTNVDSATFTCEDVPAEGWSVRIHGTSDARIKAESLDAAAQKARQLGTSVTATYILTVEPSRPAGVSPLPVPGQEPTLTAQLVLDVHKYNVVVAEAQEVVR